MFTKSHMFKVECGNVNNFLKLVGKFGFKYDISDEMTEIDMHDLTSKYRFRYIKIYATRRQINKLYEALVLIRLYRV